MDCKMKSYRISKYNPAFRVNGIYIKDEWTDYSDIGISFDNVILTIEQYEIVETNYLLVASELMGILQIEKMKLMRLESRSPQMQWHNNQWCTRDDSVMFLRDCFRNRYWGILKESSLCICLGWDFYMHICCPLTYKQICEIANRHGLFAEEVSPYCA